jgi:hypothetical protein
VDKSINEVINPGVLQLIQDENGSLSFRIQNQQDQPATILSSLPIRVFITGFLAYLAAIILRDKAGKQVDSMVMKVGHIDCTKSTREVLKPSVVVPLKESIKEGIDSGVLQLIQDENGSLPFWMQHHQDNLSVCHR